MATAYEVPQGAKGLPKYMTQICNQCKQYLTHVEKEKEKKNRNRCIFVTILYVSVRFLKIENSLFSVHLSSNHEMIRNFQIYI